MDVESRSMSDTQPFADLSERLAKKPGQFVSATYKALQAGIATPEQQRAAASGIALDYADKNRAAEAISALLDKCIALEGALEPFAKVADAFEYWCAEAMPSFSYPEQSCDVKFALEDCPNAVGELSESDFIRARAILSGNSEMTARSQQQPVAGDVVRAAWAMYERDPTIASVVELMPLARAALEAVGQSEEGSITLDQTQKEETK